MKNDKLIFALDLEDSLKTDYLLFILRDTLKWVKIGHYAYSMLGDRCFEMLKKLGYNIFLDFKFHDIPSTVARDIDRYADNIDMLTIHASGGYDMMCYARDAIDNLSSKPILIAVTILTSMRNAEFQKQFASQRDVMAQTLYLSKQAKDAGLDGVVASAFEVKAIKEFCGDNFVVITPGIRPKWASQDCQQRIMTPRDAIKNGSDYIVVGRPIIEAKYPIDAVQKIINEMS